MALSPKPNLIKFLQEELAISAASLQVALKHSEQDPGPLPMILWQYGVPERCGDRGTSYYV
jgi:hypothetical protein